MSLKILVDMNLSPGWIGILKQAGWEAVHWSEVGSPKATDQSIMAWATANGYVVFTHDLDFGMLLAITRATSPSVLQLRAQDILPDRLESIVFSVLKQHEDDLSAGALVVVDGMKNRVRVLPF